MIEPQSENSRILHLETAAYAGDQRQEIMDVWNQRRILSFHHDNHEASTAVWKLLTHLVDGILERLAGKPGPNLDQLASHISSQKDFDLATFLKEHRDLRLSFIEICRQPTYSAQNAETIHEILDEILTLVSIRAKELRSLPEYQEILKQSENSLQRLSDSNIVGILTMDQEGSILTANRAFLDMVHTDPTDLLEKRVKLSDIVYDESQTIHEEIKNELRERGTSPPKEVQIINRRDGTRNPVLIATVALGKRRLLSLLVDLSERKRIEEELLQSRRAAEAANQSKSLFLAHVSHEIRTPLGAIIGFSELLRKSNLAQSERLAYVDTITRNCRELAFLIDDILDLSKVEAGRLEVERLPLSLPKLLSDIAASLSIKAQQKNIQLNIQAQRNVPQMIVSDPNRLRQILLNIVGNAIKFTEKGSVKILCKTNETGDKLHFLVQDQGVGISKEAQQDLFQPFAQGDTKTSHRFGGTGLGLVLSRRLAQALGGDVKLIESNPGEGSTFLIAIDIGYPDAAQLGPARQSTRKEEKDESEGEGQDLRGTRILLAEDSPDIRFLVERFLIDRGAEVSSVDNGADAVRYALHNEFDLILMDMQMPTLDGYDATEELRRRGYRKPIIALTAHAMEEERRRSLRAGCNDHLTKPINKNRLIFTVAQYRGFVGQ